VATKPEITGFFIGGDMPLDQVGFMLKEVYARGTGGFQMQPVFTKPPKVQPQLTSTQQLHALPPPQINGQQHPRPPGMSLRQWLYELIKKHGTVDRSIIAQHGKLLGRKTITTNRISSTLSSLKSDRYISVNGTAYSAGPIEPTEFKKSPTSGETPPSSPSPKKPERKEPSADTQEGMILAFMRGQRGPVPLADITKLYEKKKIPPSSGSVALYTLRKKGWVKRAGPRLYEYVN